MGCSVASIIRPPTELITAPPVVTEKRLAVQVPLLTGSESDGTQLLTGNAQFSTGWTYNVATRTAAQGTAPNGLNEAIRLNDDAGTSRHGCHQGRAGLVAGGTYTWSVYAKKDAGRYLQLVAEAHGGSALVAAYYDLLTGVVTDSEIVVMGTGTVLHGATIQPAVNGFYKCSIRYKINDATTAIWAVLSLSDRDNHTGSFAFQCPMYAGDGNHDLLLWRPKLAAS